METLINEHNVELKRFPDEVLDKLRSTSEEVVGDVASSGGAQTQKVFDSFVGFRGKVSSWTVLSEEGYTRARG